MCIVQRTHHQEQFFMQFCTAVLPADICHLACAEGWMSKVWTITLTVGAVLYAHSIFFVVKTVATRTIWHQLQHRNYKLKIISRCLIFWILPKSVDGKKRCSQESYDEGQLWDAISGRHTFLKSTSLGRTLYYMMHARQPCCPGKQDRHASVVPHVRVLLVGVVDLPSHGIMIPASSAGAMLLVPVWGQKKIMRTVIGCTGTGSWTFNPMTALIWSLNLSPNLLCGC